MITEDQTAVIEFLAAAATHGGAPVERIDTHISIVFLAGRRAWKLKRAVRYDYIDASTVEIRKALCEREVRLNRRTAPSLYLRAVPVTRERDGSLALDGPGTPIEWVVEMCRFDQQLLLDRLAERGSLDLDTTARLAAAVAALHRVAEPRRDHGGAAGMAWVIDGNAAGFREFGANVLDVEAAAAVIQESRAVLDRQATLLDERRASGLVRHCHGDLHLRNVVIHDGEPIIFDCVEFNDEIACVDVLYDLAFLLMDLWRRRLPVHANVVWNEYLTEMSDLDGVPLMPLFLSCRAAIRAKTSATALRVQTGPARVQELAAAAREYLAMAGRLLRPPAPCVVAIGGLSGSGKSTLARAIAPSIGPVPGAVILRSDVVRKRLCGVPMLARLGPEGYTTEVTDRVYTTLRERAARIAQHGHAVVVDAVFQRPAEREAIEAAVRRLGVRFMGLWLDAPVEVLRERIRHRRHDVSDADAAVLELQLTRDPGTISWHRLDATGPIRSLADDVLRPLQGYVNDASPARVAAGDRPT